ncbi:RNA polymerase sigma factor [Mucilaginibacter sp.]
MQLNHSSNPELLKLICCKSNAGAEALYDQYASVIGLVIFRIVQQKKTTDILLEKTICQIWNTAEDYNEHEMPLLAWMLKIAKNLANQHMANGVISA